MNEIALVDDELLDAQRKVIQSYMAKIRAIFLLEKKEKDLRVLMDRLEIFCKLHLWDEERVMEKMSFPEIEEHRAEHALFIMHLGNFEGRYEELNCTKKIDELNFLKAWFLEHIETFDRRYAESYKRSTN
jgi:hemerythrin-like metal-binding protein